MRVGAYWNYSFDMHLNWACILLFEIHSAPQGYSGWWLQVNILCSTDRQHPSNFHDAPGSKGKVNNQAKGKSGAIWLYITFCYSNIRKQKLLVLQLVYQHNSSEWNPQNIFNSFLIEVYLNYNVVNYCCRAKWLSYIHTHIHIYIYTHTFFLYSFPLCFITGHWI